MENNKESFYTETELYARGWTPELLKTHHAHPIATHHYKPKDKSLGLEGFNLSYYSKHEIQCLESIPEVQLAMKNVRAQRNLEIELEIQQLRDNV